MLKSHIPQDFSAKQYVELAKDRNKLWRYLAVVASVVIIASMALWKAYDSRTRTDNFIKEVLEAPTSEYMSAVNVLGNGPTMVEEAAKEIRVINNDEMRQIVDRLALQRMNAEQIARRLGELSGGQRLQRVSGSLGNAAKRLDTAYKNLTDCFRAVECRPSSQTERLCKSLQGIIATINASNAEARRIKGVTINETDASSILGNGTMDLYFFKVKAPNITYINSQVCGQS